MGNILEVLKMKTKNKDVKEYKELASFCKRNYGWTVEKTANAYLIDTATFQGRKNPILDLLVDDFCDFRQNKNNISEGATKEEIEKKFSERVNELRKTKEFEMELAKRPNYSEISNKLIETIAYLRVYCNAIENNTKSFGKNAPLYQWLDTFVEKYNMILGYLSDLGFTSYDINDIIRLLGIKYNEAENYNGKINVKQIQDAAKKDLAKIVSNMKSNVPILSKTIGEDIHLDWRFNDYINSNVDVM